MSHERGKPTGNGTYEFSDGLMRKPDTRTKWKVFTDFIYNPADKTIFGHTKKRWGIVGLFYLCFYSALALLCAICTYGLLATIDEKKPSYTLESSLIGTNPGLGFRPISERTEEKSLIWYDAKNRTQIKEWVNRLDTFLDIYTNKSKLAQGGRNQMACSHNDPPRDGKVCDVEIQQKNIWGPCRHETDYGYTNSQPCVFIKLNRIFDWTPECYSSKEELPKDMPEKLKERIETATQKNPKHFNTIWVSCKGETPFDHETINDLDYYPKDNNVNIGGFAGYYYPYQNQPEYLSPLVAVQFKNPRPNTLIQVECRAWVKNVKYSSVKGDKVGSVHFELLID